MFNFVGWLPLGVKQYLPLKLCYANKLTTAVATTIKWRDFNRRPRWLTGLQSRQSRQRDTIVMALNVNLLKCAYVENRFANVAYGLPVFRRTLTQICFCFKVVCSLCMFMCQQLLPSLNDRQSASHNRS